MIIIIFNNFASVYSSNYSKKIVGSKIMIKETKYKQYNKYFHNKVSDSSIKYSSKHSEKKSNKM